MFGQKVATVALFALSSVLAKNFTIDPNSVTISERASWCTAETNTCNSLCNDDTNAIGCDPVALTATCTCSDGTVPELSDYTNSLQYFICEKAADQCIAANVGSQTGQSNCTTSIRDECGTKNASAAVTTSSVTSSSATGTATKAASSTAAASSTSSAGAMPTSLQHLGNGAAAVAIGLFVYIV
ncbi:hypothetical protein BJ170DRAFT_590052 [Xylariales sp. AK1849]|nr:hypothetical protein BJ170DRAFT_590052 [Xylariales sp. AK1849]